jgi:hydroxymethylbilane synthase
MEESISEDITADIEEFETIGQTLAQTFIDQGAKELLLRAEELAFK